MLAVAALLAPGLPRLKEWAYAGIVFVYLGADERTTRHFDEAQIIALTMGVVATNAWNRLVMSFRVPVGTYQPQRVRVSG
jgi:alkylhydroperoxidase family enzyme